MALDDHLQSLGFNAKDLKLWLSMKLSHQVCRPMSECCWWLRADRFGRLFIDFPLWPNLKFPVYVAFVYFFAYNLSFLRLEQLWSQEDVTEDVPDHKIGWSS